MALIDWFLARSQTFRILLSSIRDHKISTQQSFEKVKDHNRKLAKQLVNTEMRLRQVEDKLAELTEEEHKTMIIKKRK